MHRSAADAPFQARKISYHAQFGVKLFHRHLVGCGICSIESVSGSSRPRPLSAPSVIGFRPIAAVKEPNLHGSIAAMLQILLRTLGEDAGQWSAKDVRDLSSRAGSRVGWQPRSADHFLAAFLRSSAFVESPAAISPSRYLRWPTGGSPDWPRCLSTSEVND